MKIKATQKYIRMSPRKLRLVASIAKEMEPEEVVMKLPFLNKRAKEPILKVVKTALANGKVKGFTPDQLEFDEIQVGEGPRLKRGRAVSRGRWHPYQRKMSHVRVVLKVKEDIIKTAKKKTKNAKVTKKQVKPRSKKIGLDKIGNLRTRKSEKPTSKSESTKPAKKTLKETARDRKTVRTTNK